MAQSSEYPDLRFMPPRAFGTGRDGKAVRYIVIHYTAGSERSSSPLNGAINDQNRDDGVSTHYFVGSGLDGQLPIIQCVLTKNRGNAARTKGNRLGIQYELCGTVQTRAQWLDAASLPTLKNAARQVARDCRKYDIPVRRLTVAQTRAAWFDFPNGPKGIVGHVDITRAYPEDGGDHTDPGTEFPWSLFLDMVRDFMDDGLLEDDMALSADDKTWLKENVPTFRVDPGEAKNVRTLGGSANASVDLLLALQAAVNQLVGAAGLEAAETPDVIAAAVVAKLGAGATPQAKADLLRAALGADAAEVGRLLAA